MEEILKILPLKIREAIINNGNLYNITEIRLRVGKRLCVYYGLKELFVGLEVTLEDIVCILKNVSSNSIYSVQQDINNGYISVLGGHRIGVVGEVILADGKVKNIRNISSMNIRIAKEYIGVSDKCIDSIICNNKVSNCIIVSPPLCGKTTLLRDIVRSVSSSGKNCVVVDERGEIAAMTSGKSFLNIGERTDVISYVPKHIGMQMAVRSMAPDVVFTDEIGTEEDVEAIKYLSRSGVNFVTTMHGDSIKDIINSNMNELLKKGYIDTVIILSKKQGIGTIDTIYTNLKENKEAIL